MGLCTWAATAFSGPNGAPGRHQVSGPADKSSPLLRRHAGLRRLSLPRRSCCPPAPVRCPRRLAGGRRSLHLRATVKPPPAVTVSTQYCGETPSSQFPIDRWPLRRCLTAAAASLFWRWRPLVVSPATGLDSTLRRSLHLRATIELRYGGTASMPPTRPLFPVAVEYGLHFLLPFLDRSQLLWVSAGAVGGVSSKRQAGLRRCKANARRRVVISEAPYSTG